MNCKQKKLVFYVFLYNYLNYIWKNGIINGGYKNTNKKTYKSEENENEKKMDRSVDLRGYALCVCRLWLQQ